MEPSAWESVAGATSIQPSAPTPVWRPQMARAMDGRSPLGASDCQVRRKSFLAPWALVKGIFMFSSWRGLQSAAPRLISARRVEMSLDPAGRSACATSARWLHLHRGAVGEYFGDPVHDFGGVVARADYSVGAQFGGVLQHQLERVLTSLFTKTAEERNVASDDGLQPRSDGAHDGP